jgi:hypothetical protein
MSISNSDFSPGFNVFVSFFIATALVYAFRTWRIYQVRTKNRVAQAQMVQIIRDSVDGLAPTSKRKIATDPSASASFIISAIICCAVVYLIAYLAVIYAIYLVLPNLSVADKYVVDVAASLFLALIGILLIIPLIRRSTLLSASNQELPHWQRWLWDIGFWIQVAGVVSLTISTIPVLGNGNAIPQVQVLLLTVGFLILVGFLAPFARPFVFFPGIWVRQALANADYQEALRRAKHLVVKVPNAVVMRFNVGTAQSFAGQYVDAEATYRAILQDTLVNDRYLLFSALVMTNLGYVFLHQARYPEASRAFEGALKLDPKAGHAVAGSAEVYLFQRIQTQKALDIIINYLHKVLVGGRVSDRTVWGDVLGDEAWAFAMLGKQREAEASLADAFQRMDHSFKPGMAGLHYRAGQVYKRTKRAKAIKEFERAVALDPIGTWGRLARQALQELSREPRQNLASTER